MANTIDIGYAINYQYANLLNITPNDPEPTWAFMGQGINSISPEKSETISEDADYSTGGKTVKKVTVVDKAYSVEGERIIGNELQEFLASIEEQTGSQRETQYRLIDPTGEIIEEEVTITDIDILGPNGAANERRPISFKLARRDTPRIIQPAKGTHLPSSVTATAVTVAVGATTTVSPTVTPETASDWCLYAVRDTSIAKVSADGTVTGIKAGKTNLAIRCSAKPDVRVDVDITVTA